MTAVPRPRGGTQLAQLSLFQGDELGQEGDIREPESGKDVGHDHDGPSTSRPVRSVATNPALGRSTTTPEFASAIPPITDEYRSLPTALIEATTHTEGVEVRPKLLHSIRTVGLMHPLAVEWKAGGYHLIAGRARLAVVRALAWDEVPCHVYPPLSQELRALLPLTENVVRQPLTGVDRVNHYQALADAVGSRDRAAAALAVHRVSFFRSVRKVNRDEVNLGGGSLPRIALVVLDKLQRVAAVLDATQKHMLVSELRRVLDVLGGNNGQPESGT